MHGIVASPRPALDGGMNLADLGDRICIMGPSNSGKSTLADAIKRAHGLPAVHLDQLHHLPDTDWVPRPYADFAALHDQAIMAERWVMDGNYTMLLPQRLNRATGLILLDIGTMRALARYLRRSWFDKERRGGLAGGIDRVKWEMIHHIVVITLPNRKRYRAIFNGCSLPKLCLSTPKRTYGFLSPNGPDAMIAEERAAKPIAMPVSLIPTSSSLRRTASR